MYLLQYLSKNIPIIRIIKQNIPKRFDFSPIKTPKMGLWNLDYDQSSKKVDLTNEDHCGVCNTMRKDYLDKIVETNKTVIKK